MIILHHDRDPLKAGSQMAHYKTTTNFTGNWANLALIRHSLNDAHTKSNPPQYPGQVLWCFNPEKLYFILGYVCQR